MPRRLVRAVSQARSKHTPLAPWHPSLAPTRRTNIRYRPPAKKCDLDAHEGYTGPGSIQIAIEIGIEVVGVEVGQAVLEQTSGPAKQAIKGLHDYVTKKGGKLVSKIGPRGTITIIITGIAAGFRIHDLCTNPIHWTVIGFTCPLGRKCPKPRGWMFANIDGYYQRVGENAAPAKDWRTNCGPVSQCDWYWTESVGP